MNGNTQLWIDLHNYNPEISNKKIIEELTELSLTYQHFLDNKTTLEDLAIEVADVEIQLSKIKAIYLRRNCLGEKYYLKHKAKKVLELSEMIYE